jgi:hypothetical protein
MAEARKIRERRVHVWMQRVTEVHHDGLPGVMVVGKQQSAGRHPVLGVVNLLAMDTGSAGGN